MVGEEVIWGEVVTERFLYLHVPLLSDTAGPCNQAKPREAKKQGLALHRIGSSIMHCRALPHELVPIWGTLVPIWEIC